MVMNSRRCIAGHAPDALNPRVSDYAIKVQAVECPVRVKRVGLTVRCSLPVYPQLRTCRCTVPTDAMCQYRTWMAWPGSGGHHKMLRFYRSYGLTAGQIKG